VKEITESYGFQNYVLLDEVRVIYAGILGFVYPPFPPEQ